MVQSSVGFMASEYYKDQYPCLESVGLVIIALCGSCLSQATLNHRASSNFSLKYISC